MNSRVSSRIGAVVAALLCVSTLCALSQAPVITSFSQNGVLVCSNLLAGSVATVEWASLLSGPWKTNWQELQSVVVGQDGTIQVSVPMFYRVRGTNAPPTDMVLIPAGSFQMGDTLDEDSYALPLHDVYVSAFYMDKYEVSKALWDEVYNWAITNNYTFEYGAQGKATNHPAQSMTWYDAVKWCNARSEMEGKTPAYYTDAGLSARYRTGQVAPFVSWNSGYRLPTEAEWEKAARGGAIGRRFPWADVDTISHSRANYNSLISYSYEVSPTRGYHPEFATGVSYTSPAGYFAPNGYGLYDMAGNVWEWCWDWYGSYSSNSQTDPRGSPGGSVRVRRGGSWYHFAFYLRTAHRLYHNPDRSFWDIGFRAVLPPGQ